MMLVPAEQALTKAWSTAGAPTTLLFFMTTADGVAV
jgi:hypothetical protein